MNASDQLRLDLFSSACTHRAETNAYECGQCVEIALDVCYRLASEGLETERAVLKDVVALCRKLAEGSGSVTKKELAQALKRYDLLTAH